MNSWCGLFSHTGRELEALADLDCQFDIRLVAAITNNSKYFGTLPQRGVRVHCIPKFADINKALMDPTVVCDNCLITLNGYMGILPKDVLDHLHSRGCKVYNIHPAPIQHYPELRGKDPQERMYEGIQAGVYKYIGVVIHEVAPGVDTGQIVHWNLGIADAGMSKGELYATLHNMGTEAWLEFFEERMYEDAENT